MMLIFYVACAVCATPQADAGPSNAKALTMELSADARAGGLEVGDGELATSLSERRIEPRLGLRIVPEFLLSFGLPFLIRTLDSERESAVTTTVLGDAELNGTATLLSAQGSLKHQIFLLPGVKLPTAPVQEDASGAPVWSNLQPGCSSIVPMLAVQYSMSQELWGLRAGAGLNLPFPVREAPHRAALFSTSLEAELQPWEALAIRAGTKWLFEASGASAEGVAESNSGGITAYLATSLAVHWTAYLDASFGLDIPIMTRLRGEQEPSPIASLRFGGRWELAPESAGPPAATFAQSSVGYW